VSNMQTLSGSSQLVTAVTNMQTLAGSSALVTAVTGTQTAVSNLQNMVSGSSSLVTAVINAQTAVSGVQTAVTNMQNLVVGSSALVTAVINATYSIYGLLQWENNVQAALGLSPTGVVLQTQGQLLNDLQNIFTEVQGSSAVTYQWQGTERVIVFTNAGGSTFKLPTTSTQGFAMFVIGFQSTIRIVDGSNGCSAISGAPSGCMLTQSSLYVVTQVNTGWSVASAS